jgi:hypothetical protein
MITHIFETGYTNHIDMDVHPNGHTAYLIINKTENVNRKNFYNVKVVEIDIATRKVTRIIKEYVQDRDSPGPMGYCSIKCLPNGSLLIGLSIAISDTVVIAALDSIDNSIPVFTPTSTNTTNPTPTYVIDQAARDAAYNALTVAASMNGKFSIIEGKIILATNGLNARIDTLPTKDYVWQNIADRLAAEIKLLGTSDSSAFEHPLFNTYIRSQAQSVLLDAIQYARTNPNQSALRALIREELNK